MSTATSEQRIYVACLGCYNGGTLHGFWFDVDDDADELAEAITTKFGADENGYLSCSDLSFGDIHEETAIHAFEGFGDYPVGEYESLATLCALTELAEEHGDAVFAYASYESESDPDVLRKQFEEHYQGEHNSEKDFAQELHEQMGTDLGALEYHIDWDSVARDLFIGDFFSVDAGANGVYVFDRH